MLFAATSSYLTKYTFIFTVGEHFNHTFDDFPVMNNFDKLPSILVD